jgi:hydrogenase maturation factor
MLGPLLTKTPIRTGDARVGDRLVLTKGVALEGMSIVCEDHEKQLVKAGIFHSVADCQSFRDECATQLSVVQDAKLALQSVAEGAISSMHDPTEGGLAGALHEVADAAEKGFSVNYTDIPIASATLKVCAFFGVDPLQLISSGALLLSCAPEEAGRLVASYKNAGIWAAEIGEVVEDAQTRLMVQEDGQTKELVRPEQDALWSI